MNYKDFTRSGLSSLQRPVFNAGQLLEDDDLNAGVLYTQQLMNIMMRSLFGCGVVCGLKLEAKVNCKKLDITVHYGLALDCLGNPIRLEKPETITLDPGCDPLPPAVWVVICSTEKPCRPKEADCSSDSGQAPYTRIRYGYEIKIYEKMPSCACHCGPDSMPTAAAPPGCCGGTAATATLQTPAEENPSDVKDVFPCPCFQAHFAGECECCCDCRCVVLGVLAPSGATATDPSVWVPDTGAVRRIRPVLTGYFGCTVPIRVTELTEQDPKAPDPNLQALLGDVLATRAAQVRDGKKSAAATGAVPATTTPVTPA